MLGAVGGIDADHVVTFCAIALDQRAVARADIEPSVVLRRGVDELVHPANFALVDRSIGPVRIQVTVIVTPAGVLASARATACLHAAHTQLVV